jgi:uncharacterized protein (DUF488 family)
MEPLFTIGHATRTFEELASLLRANGVECLVDVRTVPRSRTNPQFNKDVMPRSLEPYGLHYRHIASLGGLRGRKVDVPADVNGFWENQSFHNYADYAMTPEFAAGLDELLAMGDGKRCAIMCAETVWWRCHRRIITDYLLARGLDVFHIVSSEIPEPAKITPEARAVDSHLEYPGPQQSLL